MTLPYDVHDPPLMVCGHYANATSEGKAACAVHGTTILHPDPPAKRTEWLCPSCKTVSEYAVAFADEASGTHYDGCRGWN